MKSYSWSARTSTQKHNLFTAPDAHVMHHSVINTYMTIQPADKAVEHQINSYDWYWRRGVPRKGPLAEVQSLSRWSLDGLSPVSVGFFLLYRLDIKKE